MERVAKDKMRVPDLAKMHQTHDSTSEMLTSSATIQEPSLLHWEHTSAFIFKPKVYF